MEPQKIIKLDYLQNPINSLWLDKLPKSKKYPRHWITIVDLQVTLSNQQELFIPSGTIWDGASIPRWLWWLFKPIDDFAIGDLIHDELWTKKLKQITYFHNKYGEDKFSLFDVRLFADNERLRWRSYDAPKNIQIKNKITHLFLRLFGGFYYSRQFKIPN